MAPDDVLDKLRKALARTTSPEAGEATTAAVIVARMLREHAVLDRVGNKFSYDEAFGRGYDTGRGEGYAIGYRKGIDEARAQATTQATAQPRSGAPPTHSDHDGPMKHAVMIESQYRGRCKVCGEFYDVGDDIWWRKGTGAAHDDCADEDFGGDDA